MFPINLNLEGRLALLVGAGRVGSRKLDKLMRAGARIRVVEPRPDAELQAWAETGQVELWAEFSPESLDGVSLVFAASSDRALNRAVAELAQARGQWVNVADDPGASDFILPALVERGDFQLTVATGGGSPALAAQAAARLRLIFGPEYALLSGLMAALRPLVISSALSGEERAELFRRLAGSNELREHLANGRREAAWALLEDLAAPLSLKEHRAMLEKAME